MTLFSAAIGLSVVRPVLITHLHTHALALHASPAHNSQGQGGNGKQATSKMKVLLVPFAVFYLIAHGAGAFSIGFSATCRNSRCSLVEQQRQHAKKQKPIHVSRPATCIFARSRLTDDDYAERKEQLRQLLCLNRRGIDKLVKGNPHVLQLDLGGNVAPKSEMLQRRLGIDQKKAGRILSCPGAKWLISQNQDNIQAGIDYLQNELGLSNKEVAKMLVAYPELLGRSINDHYEPLFSALQTSFGFTQEEIAKLAMKQPQSLYRASKDGINSISCLLPRVLGLDEKDKEGLKKYLHRYPSLLYSTAPSLKKSYEWILNLVGNSQSGARRVCQNCPQLFGYTQEHLQNKVDWYRDRLSLTDEEIRKVVARYPQIFGPSIEDGKMDRKISHFQQIFEINDEEMKELFLRRPQLLVLSLEKNIEPKLELYGSLIGKERAKKAVVERPNLFIESLDGRIKPRLEEVDRVYEYVKWTETLLRRLVVRPPKTWCAYMLDDAPRGRTGEKLDDSGKYKRREK